MNFITLRKATLIITLCTVGTFYQGTRFDWLGIVKSLDYESRNYVDEWFVDQDPKNHEHVCGPAEVFLPIGFDKAKIGETFFMPGVGLLVKPDNEPYSQFRYYDIADNGVCSIETFSDKAVYKQTINGVYEYLKTVAITSDNSFEIRHAIKNLTSERFETEVYCHNFFTMGTHFLKKGREIVLPYIPAGTFGNDVDFVEVDGNIFRYTKDFGPDVETVIYRMPYKDSTGNGWSFEYVEGELSVKGFCDKPFSRVNIWNNNRVACYEPFIAISIAPGEIFSWTYSFELSCAGIGRTADASEYGKNRH